jgi:hypothetical protein
MLNMVDSGAAHTRGLSRSDITTGGLPGGIPPDRVVLAVLPDA